MNQRNTKWSCLGIMLFACSVLKSKAQTDPFAPYLNSIPETKKIISKADSTAGTISITTTKFVFASRNKLNAVYAIMARPRERGRHPAILFLHGGGSKAEDLLHLVQGYALRGYVTLSVDQPGICSSSKAIDSDGPWKKGPQGEPPRFDVTGGPQTSTLADAEIAGLEAFNLLSSQPDVDGEKMGITGFSWGGYSTTMLSGLLGKRVKAAYAVFGCGYFDKGSFWKDMIGKMPKADKAVWLKYLDAGRRASTIHAAYFLEEASNDTYFWPEAASATLAAIGKHKNHVWNPNLNHKQSSYGVAMQRLYFDYYLKAEGDPFGTVSIRKVVIQPDGSKRVWIKVKLPQGIQKDSVILYYSDRNTDWQARVWKPVSAVGEGKELYWAVLPTEEVDKGINFYAHLLDKRGVATSSDMY
jgi:dienelactone hydrolase